MNTYNATYKFKENEINYEVKVTGQIFEIANDEIEFNHDSNLKKGLSIQIINAIMCAISDNQNGLFLNDKPLIMIETKLMQSNANGAYALLIDNNLYPFSMNINTKKL